MIRPTRESIRLEQEQERAAKLGNVWRFPHIKLVTPADLDLQDEAEQIFKAVNGRCPVCKATDDAHGDGNGALTVIARHGSLTFSCRCCTATHDEIEWKLRRYIKKPKASTPRPNRKTKCRTLG